MAGVEALLRELSETGAPLKLVRGELVHLTMKFLGDTQEALVPRVVTAMHHAVEGISPFSVRIVGTGAFPSLRRMNVLWVGMEGGEPLRDIARRLEEGIEPLGFPREHREFSPHITVARVKSGQGLDAVRKLLESRAKHSFGEARVDSVRLKKSILTPQGPEYFTVEEVPLRPV